jgi:hypothetical protein
VMQRIATHLSYLGFKWWRKKLDPLVLPRVHGQGRWFGQAMKNLRSQHSGEMDQGSGFNLEFAEKTEGIPGW